MANGNGIDLPRLDWLDWSAGVDLPCMIEWPPFQPDADWSGAFSGLVEAVDGPNTPWVLLPRLDCDGPAPLGEEP